MHAVHAKLAEENTQSNDQIAISNSSAAATKDVTRKVRGLIIKAP